MHRILDIETSCEAEQGFTAEDARLLEDGDFRLLRIMAKELKYITYMNNFGGFEYWPFVAYHDKLLSVEDTGETTKNIFPQWPKSYGANADTITKQTFRRTRTQEIIRSQHLR